MDKDQYINTLKNINLRPNKIKIQERDEQILLEDDNGINISTEIIEWFINNPYPDSVMLEKFAMSIYMTLPELQHQISLILSSILCEGYSKGIRGDFDEQQIQMGIDVEMEHTTDPIIARKIVYDHLVEIPDYYHRLKKMEEEAKKGE